ncbi:serine hydrolase [Sinorhizobium meliloti]|nr:serine hydrolase [Sinorhizobium meliloti]MDX0376330.1 serine hydrolase [Sinorhizobium meliloti]
MDGLAARLDRTFETAIAERRIVGGVILVMLDGELVYRRAAGLSDREEGRAMATDAIFRLASITKPIVSAVIMRLVEQGILDLDDSVTRWLPDFRPRLKDGTSPTISIRQLLTHTGGLSYRFLEQPSHAYHQLDISDGLDQPGLSIADNLARLARAPLAYPPGSSWRYSLSTDVLGAVAEAATEMSLGALVEQFVTMPLSMKDTGFVVADRARLVTPYADGSVEPVRMSDGILVPLYDSRCSFAPSRILNNATYQSGGAGMVGTASDIMTFLETIRIGGGPILQAKTVASMMSDHVGPQAATQGPGWGFGYGWSVLSDATIAKSPQAKGAIQWGGAYGHYWFVDPKNRLSVVQLTNTAFEGMAGAFPRQVRDAVYGVKT